MVPLPVPDDVRLDVVPDVAVLALVGAGQVRWQEEAEGEDVPTVSNSVLGPTSCRIVHLIVRLCKVYKSLCRFSKINIKRCQC